MKELNVNSSKSPSDLGGFKYTFGARSYDIPFDSKRLNNFRRLAKRKEPQPELYCPPDTIGKSPGVKLDPPRTHTSVNKTFSLGPGSYDLIGTNKVPTYIMKKPKEQLRSSSTAPGPGSYFQDGYMDNLMNYLHPPLTKSMGRNFLPLKRATSKDAPGPGSYDPKPLTRITGPKIKPQTATRLRPIEKERQINIKEGKKEKPKVNKRTFGTSVRSDVAPKIITPGPDAYQRIDTDWEQSRKSTGVDKERCTFGVKTMKFFQTNKNPAPNAYAYEHTTSGFAYSIGKAQRKGCQVPIYNENYYNIKNLYPGPIVTIGNEKREYITTKPKYPGPGTYNIPGTVGVIPSYLVKAEES